MERRIALATAAALTATFAAGTAAAVSNFDLLGSGGTQDVGNLDAVNVTELVDPTSSTTGATESGSSDIEIIYEDIYVTVPGAGADSRTTRPAATVVPGPLTRPSDVPPPSTDDEHEYEDDDEYPDEVDEIDEVEHEDEDEHDADHSEDDD